MWGQEPQRRPRPVVRSLAAAAAHGHPGVPAQLPLSREGVLLRPVALGASRLWGLAPQRLYGPINNCVAASQWVCFPDTDGAETSSPRRREHGAVTGFLWVVVFSPSLANKSEEQ